MKISLQTRIERYVEAYPAAISGQSGHTATFKLAIALIQGFGLSEQAALPYLQRYNLRCQPPWNEHELRHKLRGAANLQPKPGRSMKPRGYLL